MPSATPPNCDFIRSLPPRTRPNLRSSHLGGLDLLPRRPLLPMPNPNPIPILPHRPAEEAMIPFRRRRQQERRRPPPRLQRRRHHQSKPTCPFTAAATTPSPTSSPRPRSLCLSRPPSTICGRRARGSSWKGRSRLWSARWRTGRRGGVARGGSCMVVGRGCDEQ